MPKKAKVITHFGEFAESELADAAAFIYYSMKKNAAYFIRIPIELLAVKKQLGKFNRVRNSPYYNSKTAENKKLRKVLEVMLKKVGHWLNGEANGNKAFLMKSGFPFHEVFKTVGILPQTILEMIAVKTIGSLKFLISKIKVQHVRYGIMYTLVDNLETNPSKWFFHYASARKGVIPNLQNKKYYKFVSFAMGTNKELRYSIPVTMWVK